MHLGLGARVERSRHEAGEGMSFPGAGASGGHAGTARFRGNPAPCRARPPEGRGAPGGRQPRPARPPGAAPAGGEFARPGSAPTFMTGEPVSQVTVDRALDLTLGSPRGPRLTMEPAEGTRPLPRPQTERVAPQQATVPDPGWRPAGASA